MRASVVLITFVATRRHLRPRVPLPHSQAGRDGGSLRWDVRQDHAGLLRGPHGAGGGRAGRGFGGRPKGLVVKIWGSKLK